METEVTLNPSLQGLQERVLKMRQEAEKATKVLSSEQWYWSPKADVWSMVQILDHLNKVGFGVLPGCQQATERLIAKNLRSDGPFSYGFFERYMIRLLSPNPPMKLPVPPMFIPQVAPNTEGEILSRFLTLQDCLVELLKEMNGYDILAEKVQSPAMRFMKFRLGCYVEITVSHQEYHWLQVQHLLNSTDFPR